MAVDTDDLFPVRPKVQPANLEGMGIAELKAHIAALEAEIERARAAIAAKERQRHGAEALFRR